MWLSQCRIKYVGERVYLWMEAVVAAEPVWATLLAANLIFLSAVFEPPVPGCSCPRPLQVDIVDATSTQLLLQSQFEVLRRHAAGVCRCN